MTERTALSGQLVRCHYCGDADRWETDEHGYTYCECQTCECGAPFGSHTPTCHWKDDEAARGR